MPHPWLPAQQAASAPRVPSRRRRAPTTRAPPPPRGPDAAGRYARSDHSACLPPSVRLPSNAVRRELKAAHPLRRLALAARPTARRPWRPLAPLSDALSDVRTTVRHCCCSARHCCCSARPPGQNNRLPPSPEQMEAREVPWPHPPAPLPPSWGSAQQGSSGRVRPHRSPSARPLSSGQPLCQR